MKTDYHVHSTYCDGLNTLEDVVKSAILKDIKVLGISSHAPIPYENAWTMKDQSVLERYISEMIRLKDQYKNQIELYTGLEKDYFEGEQLPQDNKNWSLFPVDYMIGSVHIFACGDKHYSVDGNGEDFLITLNEMFDGNIQKFSEKYYRMLTEMTLTKDFDIIGHLDILKKNNRGNAWFTEEEKWYQKHVLDTLDAISRKEKIVEINSGGITRGYMDTFYPSAWILKECLKRNIRVMINSDAHHEKNLGAYFDRAQALIKQIGYKSQVVLKDCQWQEIGI